MLVRADFRSLAWFLSSGKRCTHNPALAERLFEKGNLHQSAETQSLESKGSPMIVRLPISISIHDDIHDRLWYLSQFYMPRY